MLNHKGQSATEMAIFGTLIIAAFSFVIMFSERINRQQSYIMQGFRESLKEARTRKGPVSYTKIADRRMPNVSAPMTLGSQETFSSDSNIIWGNRFDELEVSGNYIKLNDDPAFSLSQIGLPTVSVSGGGGTGARFAVTVEDEAGINGIKGVITGITIISGGTGYSSNPTVTITDSSNKGTGATAKATVEKGVITGITIESGGSGYLSTTPVQEKTTTGQATHIEISQDLNKSAGSNVINSEKTLKATDVIARSSKTVTGAFTNEDYTDKTFYLGKDGKYYIDSTSKLIRSGTVGSVGDEGRAGKE